MAEKAQLSRVQKSISLKKWLMQVSCGKSCKLNELTSKFEKLQLTEKPNARLKGPNASTAHKQLLWLWYLF